MIYRYEVLTHEGLFEGWGKNEQEIRNKMLDQHNISDCEVFLYGGAPRYLSLNSYRKALHAVNGNHKVVLAYEQSLFEDVTD